MGTTEWILVAVNAVLALGGFIGTLVVAILAFFVKRLINSIDVLASKVEHLELSMKDRPDHAWVGSTADKSAENRVIRHESERHGA